MSKQLEIWRGWAQVCLNDGITIMPAWVRTVLHPDCKDPDLQWSCLLGELAKPLVNDQRVSLILMDLAWGTVS